jgi:hypothetical protein
METSCVVCKEVDLVEGVESKIKINMKTMRSVGPTKFRDIKVICWIFINPTNPFYNKWASVIMGREIRGNAILMARPTGITIRIVEAAQPKTWLSVVAKLPSYVPLPPTPKSEVKSPTIQDRWGIDDGPPCGNGECDGTCTDCEDVRSCVPIYDYMDDMFAS